MIVTPADKIVVLVGPYIGDGKPETVDANIAEAEQYAIALANMGVPFFCPHLNTARFERKAQAKEDFYKRLDFIIMDRLVKSGGKGVLVAMPRWKTSGGTRAEVAWAEENSIKILYPNAPTVDGLKEVRDWYLGTGNQIDRVLCFQCGAEADEATAARVREAKADEFRCSKCVILH